MSEITTSPGVHIKKILEKSETTQAEAARQMWIDHRVLSAIVNWKRKVNEEIATKLETVFGWKASFWLNLQKGYDESQKKWPKKSKKIKDDVAQAESISDQPGPKEWEKKPKQAITFPRILYKVSKTPFKAFMSANIVHKIAWQDYVYLRRLDILVQTRQKKILAFLRDITKPWEMLSRSDLVEMQEFIRKNLK